MPWSSERSLGLMIPGGGPEHDVPALEDLPIRPYVNDDKMTADKNKAAKVMWDFKEKQAKNAQETEREITVSKAIATATCQAESDREEAKLCTGALKSSFEKISKANDEYGPSLEESLLKTRLGVEMVTSGQREYVAASTGIAKGTSQPPRCPKTL